MGGPKASVFISETQGVCAERLAVTTRPALNLQTPCRDNDDIEDLHRISADSMSPTDHIPLSVLDHFCPPNYTAISWYIPLKDDVTAQNAFAALREGLRLTFQQLSW